MKKKIYKLLSLLLILPVVVNADEISPVIPSPTGEPATPEKDFTIVFISILVIVALIFVVTLIKNKKGNK